MKYAVGMIVKDDLLDRVGVIVGWKMVTNETKHFDFIKEYKALWYYIILCENNLLYYTCEGINRLCYIDYIILNFYLLYLISIYICICTFSISFISDSINRLVSPGPINSNYIGQYFSEFREDYYMPNEMLANAYSDDISYLSN